MKSKSNDSTSVKRNHIWRVRGNIFIATIFISLLWINSVEADCSSETFNFTTEVIVIDDISATQINSPIANHVVTGVVKVAVSPGCQTCTQYIEASINPVGEQSRLIISTNENFKDYLQTETIGSFYSLLELTCDTGSPKTIRLQVRLKEENLHAPEFNKPEYKILLPLPLPANFDLTQFVDEGNGIVAVDYDLTKNQVKFTVQENPYIMVQTQSLTTGKHFTAKLITKQTLARIDNELELVITGTDEGDPPRSGTAVLKISGDPTVPYIEPPQFLQPLYKYSYKRTETFPTIEVSLRTNTFDSGVTFAASGDDKELFTVNPKVDRSGAVVTLNPETNIPETKTTLSLIVTASRPNAELDGRTAIVVEIEPEIKLLPSFERPIYTGSVDSTKVVTLGTPISLVAETITEETTIRLTGDDARYFTAKKNSDHFILLKASDELTEEILKQKCYFHFSIEAIKENVGSGVALVILEVVKQNVNLPKFEQLYYEGNVSETGDVDVTQIKVSEDSYVPEIGFTYTGDNDLFSFIENDNEITLESKDITEEKLNGKSYLLVKISASLDQTVVAETIVLIKVIRTPVIIPRFKDGFLQGTLTAATNSLTELKAVIDEETFFAGTEVILKDPHNLFQIQTPATSNEILIVLRSQVQIPNVSFLTLTLEASNPKSVTVQCLIWVEVLHVAPVFEQLLYEGQINSALELDELKLQLKPGTYDNTVQFSLLDDDAALFTHRTLETNELLISLKEPITEDDLHNRNSLRFKVRAVKQNTLETVVPVVIQIEKVSVKIPKFEKVFYKSAIGSDLRLIPFEPIQLVEDTSAEGLSVTIGSSETDLFEATITGRTVTIRLKADLTPQDVVGFKSFEFVIEVSNPGVGSGFTTILIDIVRIVPEFTKVAYSGTVMEGAKIIVFTENIELKEETNIGTISYDISGEHKDLINYAVNEDLSLKFSLKDEVTTEQLKGYSQINFVVQAINPGSSVAFTSITVTILRPVAATFEKSSYLGTLTEGQNVVHYETDTIKLLDGAEPSFTSTDEDFNLFDISIEPESNVIQTSLKPTVIWNQIRHRHYLKFTLQAINPGAAATSTTVIVDIVNLPIPTPVFSKSIYRGSLQKGTSEIAFPAPEIITLDSSTITATFTYKLIENDYQLFEVIREDNKFKVVLEASVTEQDYDGRDLLSFQIVANNQYGETDTTTVLITIPVENVITPVFREVLYKGSIQEGSTGIIQLTEIAFQQGTSTDLTEIGLVGGDSDWFEATIAESRVIVRVKNGIDIQWDQIRDRNVLGFMIQATNPGSSAASAFSLLDIERASIVSPIFKSSTFQGYLEDGSRDVKFPQDGSIELEEGSLLQGYSVSIVDNDYQLFEYAMENNQVRVSLKSTVTDQDLVNKLYLRFTVIATNPGSYKATAAVVVDLRRETTPINAPLFEHNIYQGTIGNDYTLNLETSIRVTEGTYSEDVILQLVDSNSELLRVVQNDREAVVRLSRTITAEDLKQFNNLHATIRAVNDQAAVSTCFLIVTLPDDEVEPCTTTPHVIECTDCYDCSTGEPLDDVPFFPYGNYEFNLKSDSTGAIGTVRASVKDPSVMLEHMAVFNDAYLKPKVSLLSDGMLHLLESLLPNQYTFIVVALNSAAGKQTSVSVTLDVTQIAECPSIPGVPITTVEKLLKIEALAEETNHPNIFPSKLANCEYELIDERPFMGYHYFSIDTTRNWLTAERFDRENSTLFEGMTVPQFQLRLHLKCPPDQQQSNRIEKRSLVDTNDLNFARDVTVINVIVVDINDNDPRFVSPTTGEDYHLGFPTSAIANDLLLPQLITVRANDPDEGLNAKIRFSLNSYDDFGIDPDEGVIYATKDAMKSSALVRLVVTATDLDGSADGRSSQLTMNVHRLEEDNLVAMIVDDSTDGGMVIDRINQNTKGIRLKVLMEARVPSTDDTSKSRSSGKIEPRTALRMIVYAFDIRNDLQDSNTIKEIIQSSDLSDSITSDGYKDVVCIDSGGECSALESLESTRTGLIVATSVLGALFLISAGLAVFLYLYFVRPLQKTTTNPSDIVQLENDFDISLPPTPPKYGARKMIDETPKSDDDDDDDADDRKISIQISGVTDQESEDSKIPLDRLASSLDGQLEKLDEYGSVSSRSTLKDSTTPSEPKNVKFNELVERIEVVEHHSDPEDADSDSVYNERL
ncbi:uncharacterized protein LOC131436122 isoform X2 [Malaya genurostris]|uniref:uncharacterized protein LOC131436122 isoform X2 n=1 Tax=Malaya genurostris TaxID=325434 RepID=UPI0026F4098E|nr:uncharacterized protein LOC131436122 isoform X2 [Malaya genurostris]